MHESFLIFLLFWTTSHKSVASPSEGVRVSVCVCVRSRSRHPASFSYSFLSSAHQKSWGPTLSNLFGLSKSICPASGKGKYPCNTNGHWHAKLVFISMNNSIYNPVYLCAQNDIIFTSTREKKILKKRSSSARKKFLRRQSSGG